MARLTMTTATASQLEYRSLPVRDDYPRSLALVATIAAIAVGLGVSFREPAWALFAAAVLGAFLIRYFAPTIYRFDERGVRSRFLGRERFRPWNEIRAFYPHGDGVHLSPFREPSRLDPFRGLFVRFAPGGGERAAVLAFCERHVRPAA